MKRVGLLFGGVSSEHEVSLRSAKNIYNAIDKKKFKVIPIGITKQGHWYIFNSSDFLDNEDDPVEVEIKKRKAINFKEKKDLSVFSDLVSAKKVDVVFSILHGTAGEDGKMQGFLDILGVPYVGPGVLGSAICMDKDVSKRLLVSHGIDVSKWKTVGKGEDISYENVVGDLGEIMFIKPANEGSSVGVSKVSNEVEFKAAIEEAFKYDDKILIEEAIEGREIECSVMGNKNPEASLPGEVVSQSGFYSYEEKYVSEDAAEVVVPAKLELSEIKRIMSESVKVFQALECKGMSRVDFFLTGEGRLVVNEVNTLPGFTSISMYPKMWEASGIKYRNLITRLLEFAIE